MADEDMHKFHALCELATAVRHWEDEAERTLTVEELRERLGPEGLAEIARAFMTPALEERGVTLDKFIEIAAAFVALGRMSLK